MTEENEDAPLTVERIKYEYSRSKPMIYIPERGLPEVRSVALKDLHDVIGSDNLAHSSCWYLENFGFKVLMYWDSDGLKHQRRKNVLASTILKREGVIHGPALFLLDDRDITLDEFKEIINHAMTVTDEQLDRWTDEIVENLREMLKS